MIENIKIVCLSILVMGLVTYSKNINSQEDTSNSVELDSLPLHQGIIGDNPSYLFDLKSDEAILITITQPNANVVAVVFDIGQNNNATELFRASIPDTSWLDEKIFVSAEQCRRCRIQVIPNSVGDRFGSFELSSQYISDWQSVAKTQVFQFWTKAAVHWHAVLNPNDKLDKVLDSYTEALAVSQELNLSPLVVRSQYLVARIKHRDTDYSEQKQLLNNLLLTEEIKQSAFYPLILWDYADMALIDNQLQDAALYIERLSEVALTRKDPLLQAAANSVKATAANIQGQYRTAENLYEKVSDIYLATGNWRKSVEALTSQGWFQYRSGENEKALKNYRNALSIATKAELQELQIDLNTKIASIYRNTGNVNRANQYINIALRLSESQPLTRVAGWAKQEKARIYMETGLWELAADILEDAKVLFQTINLERDVSNIEYFLADAYLQLKDFSKAKRHLNRVLEYDMARGSHYDIGTGYSRLAKIALAETRYPQALKYQHQALDYLSDVDDRFLLGRQYSQTAVIYAKNNMMAQSADYFARANVIQEELQDKLGQIETGYEQALILRANGDKTSALNILSEIIEYIRHERDRIMARDVKRNFLAIQQNAVSLHITLSQEAGAAPTQTLLFADSFRSQTLADRFTEMNNFVEVSPELLTKRKALEAKLQQGVVSYQALTSVEGRNAIAKEARKIVAELRALDAKIRTEQSKSESTSSSFQRELDINQLQSGLDEHTAALYFDTTETGSHLWIITANEINYQTLPAEALLQPLITQLLELIGNKPNHSQRRQQLNELIVSLTAALFENTDIPWSDLNSVIVVPDGPINYLPFSVLHVPGSTQSFLETLNVSYAPSLSVLLELKHTVNKPLSEDSILIVANPKLNAPESLVPQDTSLRAGFSSYELPYTEKEIAAIQNTSKAKTQVLSGANAGKQEFMSMPLSQFNIVHLATHGLANNYVPSLGGLVFSNANSSDNLLLAPEIVNLKLNAELVVLSACETGYGRLIEGEGLQGLSRSFFEAGAQRVIASLWPVQDDATAALMTAFYKHLLQFNKPVEEALRLAKLEVKNFQRKNRQKPWRDPFYWAGFELQGPGGKISGR